MTTQEREVLEKLQGMFKAMGVPQEHINTEMERAFKEAQEDEKLEVKDEDEVRRLFGMPPREVLKKPIDIKRTFRRENPMPPLSTRKEAPKPMRLSASTVEDIVKRYDNISHYLDCISYELRKMPNSPVNIQELDVKYKSMQGTVNVNRRQVYNYAE